MEQRFSRRWGILDRINFLQRKVIINSIIYYEMGKSVMSDKDFDDISHQLVSLQEQLQDIEDQTTYGYMMFDFDGSTGFDLPSRLNPEDHEYLSLIANRIFYKINGAQKEDKKKIHKKKERKKLF
jgi:hypothetical protein